MASKLVADQTSGVGGTFAITDEVQNSAGALRTADGDGKFNVLFALKGLNLTGNTYVIPVAKTANFTIGDVANTGTIYPCDATSGAFTATLQAVASSTGKIVTLVKTDTSANAVIVDANASELIGGALIYALYRFGDSITFFCDGSAWYLIGSRPTVLYQSTAASSAVVSTASETQFDTLFTSVANTLKAGDAWRVSAYATNTAGNSSDTLTLKLKIGTGAIASQTAIVSTVAFDVTDGGGDEGYFDAEIVFRTVGASGTFVARGTQALGVPATVTAKPFFKASAAVDTTSALQVSISATWSNSSALNSCRLDLLTVERLAG